jgi:hypothetical protein
MGEVSTDHESQILKRITPVVQDLNVLYSDGQYMHPVYWPHMLT